MRSLRRCHDDIAPFGQPLAQHYSASFRKLRRRHDFRHPMKTIGPILLHLVVVKGTAGLNAFTVGPCFVISIAAPW